MFSDYNQLEKCHMKKIVLLVIALMGATSAFAAESLYLKGTNVLTIKSIDSKKLDFNLDLGVQKGRKACVEGDVDCVGITASAVSKDGKSYGYSNQDDDCSFNLIQESPTTVKISNAKGSCGTGSANRKVLPTINGVYKK